jgi:dethiobiotin synthetase
MTVPTFFITGTDTGCGKTTVTAALGELLGQAGHRVACFKPIASGCDWIDGRWQNEDARALMAASHPPLAYETVNPVALPEAIAPHIAAQRAGVEIDIEALAGAIRSHQSDVRLVEGAGGWMVPMGQAAMTADLARAIGAQIILVVGLRLGAINHALLTARCIEEDGLSLAGWIGNRLDPEQPVQDENIATVRDRLGPPLALLEHGGRWHEAGSPEQFGSTTSALARLLIPH